MDLIYLCLYKIVIQFQILYFKVYLSNIYHIDEQFSNIV